MRTVKLTLTEDQARLLYYVLPEIVDRAEREAHDHGTAGESVPALYTNEKQQ